MLNVLTFNEISSDSKLKEKIMYKFLKPVTVNETSYDNLNIKHVNAIKRKNKIPWKKISRTLGNYNQQILCSSDVLFPPNFKFTRYEPLNLNRILCQNAAIETLKLAKASKSKLSVTIFDPLGCYGNIVYRLLPFLHQIKVITKNIEFYARESEILMEQYGASILVCNSVSWIRPCHMLIAPDKIITPLSLPKECITFTGFRPNTSLNGSVYYNYKVKIPSKFKKIIPHGINSEYFLSALIDSHNISSTDNITPELCTSSIGVTSIEDISQNLVRKINLS